MAMAPWPNDVQGIVAHVSGLPVSSFRNGRSVSVPLPSEVPMVYQQRPVQAATSEPQKASKPEAPAQRGCSTVFVPLC